MPAPLKPSAEYITREEWIAATEAPMRAAVAEVLKAPDAAAAGVPELVGRVMRAIKGKGNPCEAVEMIRRALALQIAAAPDTETPEDAVARRAKDFDKNG